MATVHMCDRCGRTVKSRDEFMKCELSPVGKVMRTVGSPSRYRAWELCPRCYKHVLCALEGGDCGNR